METGFKIVDPRPRRAGAWEEVKSNSNLKDQIIEGIIGVVVDTIVKKAVPKLSRVHSGAGFTALFRSTTPSRCS
jgi:hypothetical protein